VEQYCTAGYATDENMEHAHCMLDTEVYKHTLSVCANAEMVAQMRRNVTLYVHWLSCYK
jgi:hypothetical protein